MNITKPFLYQCRYNAHLAALCMPGEPSQLVSYGRLARWMNNASRRALQLGLSPGDVVAIFVDDPILHAVIILGLSQLGIVTCSGRSPDLPFSVDALIADNAFPYIAPQIIRADRTWIDGDGAPLPQTLLSEFKSDQPCRIVLTSGTTGDAKAVGLTEKMLADRIARHNYVFGELLPQCRRTFCDMGYATSLGFQFLIYTLWRGGTFFVPGESAESVAHALELYDVENMMTSPAGLANHVRFYEEHPSANCTFRMIVTGGSMLSSALAVRARARISGHIVAAYGSTETSMVAAAPAQLLARKTGAVGYVLPDTTVEVVKDGERVREGSEGEIRVRSPYNANGYLDDDAGSQASFLEDWFYPGDLGHLDAEGLLVISGRGKTVMNLGGDKVKPELVEQVLASFNGVTDAAVFAVGTELGVDEICALVVGSKWDETGLRNHCGTKLPENFIPRRFVAVDSLPRNALGKLERRLLPEIARKNMN